MLLAALIACVTVASQPAPVSSDTPSLEHAARAAQVAWPPPAVRIEIDKSDRRLTVYSGPTALKSYRVGLGGSPTGDKEVEGDSRTPNGAFTVVTRNERSRFHRFLGLSYPMPEDADRGLREQLITAAQAARIREAAARRARPPWDTALGGEIGIHGSGSSSDWTLGCIAVEDGEIEELWEVAPLGTEVVIRE